MKSPISSYPAKSKTGGKAPYHPSTPKASINPQTKRHAAPRISDRGKGTK
jgi:hypothetical protein